MKRTEFTKAEIEDDNEAFDSDRLWLWIAGAVAVALLIGCIAGTVAFFKLMGSM